MIYAFWGTVAGVVALLLWAAHQAIPTFGAPEPAGAHHKPRAPRNWSPLHVYVVAAIWVAVIHHERRRDRRQRERARDEATVDTFRDIHAGQYLETLPAAAGPLMPLPPEVEHVREPYGHDAPGMPDDAYYCAADGQQWPCADAEVVTPRDEAGAYVGPVTGHTGAAPETCPECPPAPEPEPAPLTDYREETGSWEAIRDDVLAGGE
jgi:hypothetical protein